MRRLRRRLRRRRPHMLRKLREQRRAGWFVVSSNAPAVRREAEEDLAAERLLAMREAVIQINKQK